MLPKLHNSRSVWPLLFCEFVVLVEEYGNSPTRRCAFHCHNIPRSIFWAFLALKRIRWKKVERSIFVARYFSGKIPSQPHVLSSKRLITPYELETKCVHVIEGILLKTDTLLASRRTRSDYLFEIWKNPFFFRRSMLQQPIPFIVMDLQDILRVCMLVSRRLRSSLEYCISRLTSKPREGGS